MSGLGRQVRGLGRAPAALVACAMLLLAGGCAAGDDAAVTRSTTSTEAGAAADASDGPAGGASAGTGAASSPGADTFAYAGREGATALDLLRELDPSATVSGSGASAFVTSINGRAADQAKQEYWALYVNGEFATVGAGALKTHAGDRIEWRISTF